jgi:RNA polymerase sigma-70 factor (ECF subfamily)
VTKSTRSPHYTNVTRPDRPPGSGLEEFDAIYEREFDYVWRSVGRLGVQSADIADAVHDVFLVLYRRWNELERKAEIRPWLFGVARRVAAGMRAKRREESSELEPATVDDPQAAMRSLLRSAMGQLDDDRRAVVILHDLEGHTGAEVAAILDIPVNTVHSRLRLARADLLAIVKQLQRPK